MNNGRISTNNNTFLFETVIEQISNNIINEI